MSVIPVIMSGGSGTRLWPISRKERPKQFLGLGQGQTFFQQTVLRCRNQFFDARPIVIASDDHRFLVAENLKELDCKADILLEPVPRNSCAAVIAGCLQALERDANATVIVLAADHLVKDRDGFLHTAQLAEPAARLGKLVTFGIVPDRPATGYGYVLKEDEEVSPRCFPVSQFVEKPDAETAKLYVEDGYLWNSGNFLFSAEAFLEEARLFVPEIVEAVSKAHSNRVEDLDFQRLEERSFASARAISIDYAVMEKTKNAAVVPAEHDWADIGTWHSVWETLPKSEQGNALVGDTKVFSGEGNVVYSPEKLTTLVGVDDLVVVSTPDVVLVSSREKAEGVGQLVKELEKMGRTEATSPRKVYRPWGSYDVIDSGNNYKAKRIEINPGATLSLQKHNHRAEHWVVVKGEPEVTIGEKVLTLLPNQSIYIPKGTVHRLANRTGEKIVLIEVQTGDYLGEDDIVRLEDVYNRDTQDRL